MSTFITEVFNKEITKAYKPLTKEVELDMIYNAQQGSTFARNALVNSQLRKLIEIAKKYLVTNKNNDLSELVAVGIAGYKGKNGLNNAIKVFDPTRGVRLITYAYQFMQNAIRDYSVDNHMIHIPRNKSKSVPNDPALIEKYTIYAEARGMTLDQYIEHRLQYGETISLRRQAYQTNLIGFDTPITSDGGMTIGDTISDDTINMDSVFEKEDINNMLASLTNDERDFIIDHFYNDMTMQEMGDARGISRQAVSNCMTKILDKAGKRLAK
jgi:RNA polymerase sigma factor (sigma-70 family)